MPSAEAISLIKKHRARPTLDRSRVRATYPCLFQDPVGPSCYPRCLHPEIRAACEEAALTPQVGSRFIPVSDNTDTSTEIAGGGQVEESIEF